MSKNIIIQTDHWPNIQSLSKEQAGELIQACIAEALGLEPDITSQAVVIVFEPIRKAIVLKRKQEEVKDQLSDLVKQEELRMKIRKNLKVVHKN